MNYVVIMQNFLDRATNSRGIVLTTYFWQNISSNCIKMNKIGGRGGSVHVLSWIGHCHYCILCTFFNKNFLRFDVQINSTRKYPIVAWKT